MKKWFPLVLIVALSAWVLSSLRYPTPKHGLDWVGFGQLPVLMNGRLQPLDSVAMNSLLQIRTRRTVRTEDGSTLSATEWMLEAMTRPETADTRKIFRIDNNEVLSLLKLPDNEKYFSFNQLSNYVDEIQQQAQRINGIEAPRRTPFERHVMRLYNAMFLYIRLKNSLMPEGTTNYTALIDEYKKAIPSGMEAFHAQEQGKNANQSALNQLSGFVQSFSQLERMAMPLIVPPTDPVKNPNGWLNAGAALLEAVRAREVHPVLIIYAKMADASRAGNATEFNQAVGELRQWLADKGFTKPLKKARAEFFFNHFQPFYKATVIYVLAFLLAAVSLFNLSSWLRKSAINATFIALLLHTTGLVFRMALEGRPPVTNLYSSAVFIGWAAVLIGLALERYFPLAIGVFMASAIGVATQIIAHNLALGGDTMEMLRAVLDTNFWLATHVITITLGYSATFLAGFFGLLYVLLGVFSRRLTPELAQALHRMVYATTCFAALFSFTGTVLGGIWADQSWGRFWGWDPKENGALIIVLWNAVYLHARWGKLLEERGLMNVAIFGNVVTAWSWFGVNMLGVGLHSYGFMDAAFKALLIFVGFQIAVIALGCLPIRMWKSHPDKQPDALQSTPGAAQAATPQ